jgi:predicted enzyme related to lactoylglutathione lyase
MGDMQADNSWKIYLACADAPAMTAAAEADSGTVRVAVGAVADLGNQAILADPSGAVFGIWEPVTFPGFTVLDEPGAPSWFELHTPSYSAALDFYRTMFEWRTEVISDSDEFRYTTVVDSGGTQLAGVMDAQWLPESATGSWTTYWETADVDATAADVARLGGTIVDGPTDTPYGRMATVTDPNGAEFRLRTGPTG